MRLDLIYIGINESECNKQNLGFLQVYYLLICKYNTIINMRLDLIINIIY